MGDKATYDSLVSPSGDARMIDVTESLSALRSVLMDGIDLIGKLYDFSSEEGFLRDLPGSKALRG